MYGGVFADNAQFTDMYKDVDLTSAKDVMAMDEKLAKLMQQEELRQDRQINIIPKDDFGKVAMEKNAQNHTLSSYAKAEYKNLPKWDVVTPQLNNQMNKHNFNKWKKDYDKQHSQKYSSLQQQVSSLQKKINKPNVVYKEKPSLFGNVYYNYESPQYSRLFQWSKDLIPEDYSYLKKKELEYYLGKLIKSELSKYSSESDIRNTIRTLLRNDPSYTEFKIKSLAPKKPKKKPKKKSKKKSKKKPKKKPKKKSKKKSKKKPKKK